MNTPNNNSGKEFGLVDDKFTIFISGGSQGSKPINSHILRNVSFYKNLDAQLIWQCGQRDYNFISTQDLGSNIHLFDFIKDIGKIYAVSDIVISRSGALSVSEILVCGKASILIPYPQAAADHQHINAKATTVAGASILVPQKDLELGVLEEAVMSLFTNPEKIQNMQHAALSISKPNATKEIVDEIYKLIIN